MNIRDVAKKARVSTATVSRVMSGIDVVKPETAKRVRKAIDALSYVPNLSARTLSKGRSHLFGVVISDITNPFFPDLIYAFNELAEQHNYRAVFANTNYSPERMERCITGMLEQKVEGIAIMTSEMSENSIRMIADRGIPVASMHTSLEHENTSHIIIDYKSGMEQAIDHIISLGHERIAFIGGPQNLSSAVVRQDIFLGSMKEKGFRLDKNYLTSGNHRVDGGYGAMRRLLQNKTLPTAVICSNDLTAIGAITAIYEAGLSVPKDISIVGYDDIEISSAFNPALTTVRLSRAEIATRAFFALYMATNGVNDSKAAKTASRNVQHMVPTELVIRKSTAPPTNLIA
jgi:DNA-binding LacI/PurR family transcriptional regulator